MGKAPRRLGVGVVGYGYWGPNQVRVFNDHARAEVKAVCDLDPERLARAARRHPGITTTQKVEDLLARPDVEAVVVVSSVSTHYRIARAALEAGKHVLVEKPMALDRREIIDLYRLARSRKLVLMGGYTFLYSPAVMKVKEVLESGTLGELYYIDSSRVNLGLHQFDVSVLWDLGPHDLSMIFYWLGELPEWIQAAAGGYAGRGLEDVAWMAMRFPSGVCAHSHVSWLAPAKLRRMTLTGSRQMVLYDDLELVEKVKIFDQGIKDPESVEAHREHQVSYRFGDIHVPRLGNAEPLAQEAGDFIASVLDGGTPRSSGAIALGITAALEAAEQSLRSGGVRVPLGMGMADVQRLLQA